MFSAGYGVDSDFRNLVSSCPLFEDSVRRLARFVDLCPLSKQVGRNQLCCCVQIFLMVNARNMLRPYIS